MFPLRLAEKLGTKARCGQGSELPFRQAIPPTAGVTWILLSAEVTVLASRIPEIMAIEPPASSEQLDGLASALGLELPDEYRALLAEANGVSANLVQIYRAEDVPEAQRDA